MVSPPPPAPEDVPITSSRAMRLAITRAADKTHGIVINVTGLREETLSLEDMLAAQNPDHMLMAMVADAEVVGLAALDLHLRAALIEAQTVGKVLEVAPDDRPPTFTDASMAEPLLAAMLHHMAETTVRTPLEGWGQGIVTSGLIPSARSAGLILEDRTYRVVRMTLDLGVADRVGELVFALPDAKQNTTAEPTTPEVEDWATRFQRTVNASSVRLDAQLHRFKLPIYVADGLEVGQVLPLPGCKVTSLKLLARDGRTVATARLGQAGGLRAVRIETAMVPEMEDLDHFGGGTSGSIPALDYGSDAPEPMFGGMADETDENTEFAVDDADMTAWDMETDETTEISDTDIPMAAMAPLDWSEEELSES